jgi:hypothetical protein
MLATVQNIASSLFNSHLMDAYEGWLYVLVVGISGGELLRVKKVVSRTFHPEIPQNRAVLIRGKSCEV